MEKSLKATSSSANIILGKYDITIPPQNALFMLKYYIKFAQPEEVFKRFHTLFSLQAKQPIDIIQMYYDFITKYFTQQVKTISYFQEELSKDTLHGPFREALDIQKNIVLTGFMTKFTETDTEINKVLLPAINDEKTQIILHHLFGEVYRIAYKLLTDIKKTAMTPRVMQSYVAALELANDNYISSHPDNLSLIIDFAVFRKECLGLRDDPLYDISRAYSDCFSTLSQLEKADYQKSVKLMEIMTKNMALWTKQKEKPQDQKKKLHEARKVKSKGFD